MSAPTLPIPYCGLPPSPETLWSRWNLDPILISVFLLLVGIYALGAWRARANGRAMPAWRRASFYVGWATTAAALISPLCPLSVSLFAARIGQHMLLMLIGAPLVAAGRPFATVSNLWRTSELGRDNNAAAPICAAAMFAVLLWFWHAPAPYAETFRSTFVYWSMHITLYGAALWLWSCGDRLPDISPPRRRSRWRLRRSPRLPTGRSGRCSSIYPWVCGAASRISKTRSTNC